MREGGKQSEETSHQNTTPADAELGQGDVYLYRDSGIQERHGTIPLWLKALVVGLIVWGIYYTIRYWSAY